MRKTAVAIGTWTGTLFVCNSSEYDTMRRRDGVGPIYNGYWLGGIIVVYEGAHDLEGLVAHELGHAKGLDHVWTPTTMFPGWWGRWSDPEGLRPLAAQAMARLEPSPAP